MKVTLLLGPQWRSILADPSDFPGRLQIFTALSRCPISPMYVPIYYYATEPVFKGTITTFHVNVQSMLMVIIVN